MFDNWGYDDKQLDLEVFLKDVLSTLSIVVDVCKTFPQDQTIPWNFHTLDLNTL